MIDQFTSMAPIALKTGSRYSPLVLWNCPILARSWPAIAAGSDALTLMIWSPSSYALSKKLLPLLMASAASAEPWLNRARDEASSAHKTSTLAAPAV